MHTGNDIYKLHRRVFLLTIFVDHRWEWWRESLGEREPHQEDVLNRERKPLNCTDEFLPGLEWEDPTTEESNET